MTVKYEKQTHEPCKPAPHDNQRLISINGFEFYADIEMIPLIEAINESGLQTYSHCAGHQPGGCAWVVLELDGVEIEIRPKENRSQLILRWQPSWLIPLTNGDQS